MSIARLLTQTATIHAKTGYNKAGRDIASSTGVLANCRFENFNKTKMDKTGAQVLLLGRFFFNGDVQISIEDRVIFAGISYKVFTVNGSIDSRGNQRLVECEVQKWQTTA